MMKEKKIYMVKKILLGASLAVLMLGLTACGDSGNNATESANATTEVTTVQEDTEAKEEATTAEATTAEATTESTESTESDAASSSDSSSKSGMLPYDGDEIISAYSTFELTSEDLHDGVWDDVVSFTDKGSNVSPQLSWEPVEGASTYAIYMLDISMHYWIHWISNDVTETTLPQGWAPASDYVGPYPPEGGSHTYDVYVIALKNPVERLKGGINSTTEKAPEFIAATDVDADGNSGNIISIGHLSGEFSR